MSLSFSVPLFDCFIDEPFISPPIAGVKYFESIDSASESLPIIFDIAVYPPEVMASGLIVYRGKSNAFSNSSTTDGGTRLTGKQTSWL